MPKPRLAIDWDGTCVRSAWPKMGTWMPGAVEALSKLSEWADIVIYTARVAPVELDGITPRAQEAVDYEIAEIRRMLDAEGLSQVGIHLAPWKPGAFAYVDDRAVRYQGRAKSWENLVPRLAALAERFHAMYPEYKADA